MLFETERLTIRRLGPKDIPELYAVYSDPVAMRWVDDGLPITQEECDRWLDVTLANYAARGYGMSVLQLRETEQVIGFMGLVHPAGQQVAELKYALRREHWGQGYATEAARGMLSYGEETFGLKEVIATTATENSASHRVLEKVGMQHEVDRENGDGSVTRVFRWLARGSAAPKG